MERYGSDMNYYIEAKFEIAHLYIKKKQYDQAEPLLREILDIYANSMPGQYPSSFKKLAELETAAEIRVHRGTGYSLEKKA